MSTTRRAVILAAGIGERLRPLTLKVPKCLLPIQGRPLLGTWLDVCERAGIDKVLVNTHHLSGQVEWFLRSRRSGPEVRVSHEPRLLGSAGTLAGGGDFLREGPFAVIYADTFIPRADLDAMFRCHAEHAEIVTLGLFTTTAPSECGIVEVSEEGQILSFVEKPAHPASRLASAGLLVADPAILELLPEKVPADLGTDVLPNLAGRMRGFLIDGPVVDVGTPERYRDAQESARRVGWGRSEISRNERPRADRLERMGV